MNNTLLKNTTHYAEDFSKTTIGQVLLGFDMPNASSSHAIAAIERAKREEQSARDLHDLLVCFKERIEDNSKEGKFDVCIPIKGYCFDLTYSKFMRMDRLSQLSNIRVDSDVAKILFDSLEGQGYNIIDSRVYILVQWR